MKKTLLYSFGAAIILIVLAGSFYWFQWRPSNIGAICAKEASASFFNQYAVHGGLDLTSYQISEPIPKKTQDEFYQNCLREKGLK